jgi:hypothetical protein
VDFNARKVAQVVVGLMLATLAVLAVVFTVTGIHKNSTINDLRQHGVAVDVHVTGCLGLLGGSGSNAAGYTCQGTFTLGGHHYGDTLPGSTFYRPGTIVRSVTVAGDPASTTPVGQLAAEHASANVFTLPLVLFALFLLLGGGILLRRRQKARTRA